MAVGYIRAFDENCQFPNCVAAIERKHICIPKPPSSGFRYFSNKPTFSIILLAVNDANNKFLYTDVECPVLKAVQECDRTRPCRKHTKGQINRLATPC